MPDRIRALVISPQPFFSPRGTPYSVYYRATVMAELGIRQDILTYGEGEDVVIEGARIVRGPRLMMLGPIRIGPSLKKAILDLCLIFQTIGLLLRHRYQLVHAHEEAVFWARWLKPVFRFKLLYDMHSSLPEQLDNFEFSRASWLVRLFTTLERDCLRAADAVITICPALADQAQAVDSSVALKHRLIENSIFDPVKVTDGSAAHGAEARCCPTDVVPNDPTRTVAYVGTLEPYQGIDLLLEGFARADLTSCRLLVAGGSEEQVRRYRRQADDLGIASRCHFLGRVSPERARAINRSADVLVSPRQSGNNTPLKIYEQLASGVPLLATNIYSHTQVLDDRIACLVDPTPEGMADGLRRLLEDPAYGAALAQQAGARYRERYARDVYARKMSEVVDILALEASPAR